MKNTPTKDNLPAVDHVANREAVGYPNKQQTIEKQQS
jgi:hypothetical protein